MDKASENAAVEGPVHVDAGSTKLDAIHTVVPETRTVKSMPECTDERELVS